MQDPKELIIEKIKWYLGEMGVLSVEPEVSLVSDLKFGDFTTNVAMVMKKLIPDLVGDDKRQVGEQRIIENEGEDNREIGDVNDPNRNNDQGSSRLRSYNNPREIAEFLISKLKESKDVMQMFDRIEVAGPGFINFYLSKITLVKSLDEFIQSDSKFKDRYNKTPQKIIVEFGDPNPFKEIHIGHLRNFCIGESFCRLLESQGNTVTRANYQGDVGMHVAKALWGLQNRVGGSESEEFTPQDLAKAYAHGATEFEKSDEVKNKIIEINKKIYLEDHDLMGLWKKGRQVSLDHFEKMYKRIGIKYDKYYFESVTAKKGKDIVLSHIEDGVFEKSDGAIVYKGEKDGLHTRVFLTSQNYATYEGKDLALSILKSEDNSIETSVILTGNEQLEYFQVMLAALRRIEPKLADATIHHTFGHVRLKEGKMSSRTGDVITASWLLDEAVKRVKGQFGDMDIDTAEKVGVGAVKYSMLKFSIPSDIHFSFEESVSLEGNSGPYLQYTYVRTQSVLSKSQITNTNFQTNLNNQIQKMEKEEEDLLRFLAQYPYHLSQAADEFAPNLLCNYLFELSQKFNLFYQKHKIIGKENEEFRLCLTKVTGLVIKNGLNILGIESVEKM